MLEGYKILQKGGVGELVEKKSKFIATTYPVSTEEEAITFIEATKKKYWNASHNCTAYIIGENYEIQRCSDDGEPSGTAGMPILNVLESNNLNNILCIVIRYFGGIKLGAGGLVRTYTKAVTECLEKAVIVNLVEGKKLKIKFNYENIKQIDFILTNIKIIDKSFDEKITYTILISDNKYQEIYHEILNNTVNIVELEKILIAE